MIRSYLTSLIAFVALDSVWLGTIAPEFYRAHIGHLMSDSPELLAAALFYILFLIGLQLFVLSPLREASVLRQGAQGFAFGVVTYATFDLTSVAVLKDFPYLVAGVDMLWGGLLSMGICLITARLSPQAEG